MKFTEIKYERPDFDAMSSRLKSILERFKNASTAEECFAAYREYDEYSYEIFAVINVAFIRNSMDTNDEFYESEVDYWDETEPELEEIFNEFIKALLASKFRKELETEFGSLMFINQEIELRTFNPDIIEDLKEENALRTEYDKLKASAQIEFNGLTLTLAELYPYIENTNRSIRKAAIEASAGWYMANAEKFDTIFDKMVKCRTKIAKKLGYDNFVGLGYDRMSRNCYDKGMVAAFREGIRKYIVPVTVNFKKEQAKRIGVETIKYYDKNCLYPDGNADPKGSADDILAHAKRMYQELSSETAEYIDLMFEKELFDVLTRPGKSSGGYCSYLHYYQMQFIFANFNGTSGDVDVLTHEVGHALAGYLARDIYPTSLRESTEDISEIHSMAMEFFAWPWMEGFFGEQTEKYYNIHLSESLTFLPYGVMVDEFQHYIYDNPEMSPAERNEYWLKLEAKYRPWLDLSDTPFYSEGRRWQAQLHIYTDPFYYIDYCLAGVMALYFWVEIQKDSKKAWDKYLRLTKLAGTKTFVDVIKDSGLPTPFESENIKIIADAVTSWLDNR